MSAAWLFPGQGSQYIGMGLQWASRVPASRAALEEASDVLGFDVPALLERGPVESLADTYNQQPAMLATSIAVLRAVEGELPAPSLVAGHSMGEYSALVAAQALPYADALRLVRERGRLMKHAGEVGPGGMAAILGLADEEVADLCRGAPGCQVANYNAPGQVVISGATDAVAAVVDAARAAGAIKVVPLPITIAAHSRLMEPVAGEFAAAVAAAPLVAPVVPVVGNVTARPLRGVEELREELSSQLTRSVLWTASVRTMLASGVRGFYEVGPGTVLAGLVRRTLKADGVEAAVASLGEPPAEAVASPPAAASGGPAAASPGGPAR